MNKEQIDKEFDEKFNGKIKIDNRQGYYNTPIKDFIHQQIEKVIDELA